MLEGEVYGTIRILIDDPEITEVMINGTSEIYYEARGDLKKWQGSFEGSLESFVQRLLQILDRSADRRHPLVDGMLPGNIRVHVALPPASDQVALTFRKHTAQDWSLENLVSAGMLPPQMAQKCKDWVLQRKNFLICGPTNAGKTTFLRALLRCVPQEERIITIEDTSELLFKRENHVSLISRESPEGFFPPITLSQLLRHSLRMRPDRLVLGEVRGEEAAFLLDALATGHRGSMCSLHGVNAKQALNRLEGLVLRAMPHWPLQAIRQMILDSIDVILVLEKTNGLRTLSQAVHISGIESFGFLLHNEF